MRLCQGWRYSKKTFESITLAIVMENKAPHWNAINPGISFGGGEKTEKTEASFKPEEAIVSQKSYLKVLRTWQTTWKRMQQWKWWARPHLPQDFSAMHNSHSLPSMSEHQRWTWCVGGQYLFPMWTHSLNCFFLLFTINLTLVINLLKIGD